MYNAILHYFNLRTLFSSGDVGYSYRLP